MSPTLPQSLLLLLSLLCVPSLSYSESPILAPPNGGIGIPLHRPRTLARRSDPVQLKAWLQREQNRLQGKYDIVLPPEEELLKRALEERATTSLSVAGYGSPTTPSSGNAASSTRTAADGKPSTPVGMISLSNQDHDTEYFASIGVGVPPQYMNVILDTGSADLWIPSTNCTALTGCNITQTVVFNASSSVTGVDEGDTFSVRYGSGSASGTLWQDYVSFGGYNVSGQGYALVDTLSPGLLSGNISGLLGLGFESLAASGVTPFWQNLWQAGVLPFPGFSFMMSRFVNVSSALEIEPGGLMTLGYLNYSSFSGDISWTDIPDGLESFWVIPMDALTVNGTNTTGVSGSYVAVDTGTTLCGGPSSVVKQIYAAIPGALAATGAYTGYYSYPCQTKVNISLTFGGVAWNMSSDDFNLGSFGVSNNVSTCLGAFFDLSLSSSSKISWVIGAAFLKNVYSVFRASPSAVGFAVLASNGHAIHYNSSNQSYPDSINGVPSGIYGPSAVTQMPTSVPDSVTTAIEAGQTVSRMSSGGDGRAAIRNWGVLVGAVGLGLGLLR